MSVVNETMCQILCCKLTIDKKPKKAWTLKRGERFLLSPSGYSALNDRIEVYLKVSHTKAVLDSVPEKFEVTIPVLTVNTNGLVYKLIDEWLIQG